MTLFHVEHAVRTGLEGDGAFGPRNQDLGANGSQALDMMRWGLVPFWAKDPLIGRKAVNARAETAPASSLR